MSGRAGTRLSATTMGRIRPRESRYTAESDCNAFGTGKHAIVAEDELGNLANGPGQRAGVQFRVPPRRHQGLHPFDHRGDAHAAADAERDQRGCFVSPLQLVQGRAEQAGPG